MLPEQVASVRSFLQNAGRPPRFTIVSDGTYTSQSVALLEQIDDCVTIETASTWLPRDVPNDLRPYLTSHPTGRQLALIMCLPMNGPAVYADSDVLFFNAAHELATVPASNGAVAHYLPDCGFSGDRRLLRDVEEEAQPVNTGFLLLVRPLDWRGALDRLRQLRGEPTFFTNQTLTHIAMHENGAVALDPRKYVLQLDDQFEFPDRYVSADIALRHYVNPVRHKMWTTLRKNR